MENNDALDDHFMDRWRQVLRQIQEGFPSPWKETHKDLFLETSFKQALTEANNLKHNREYEGGSALKSYLGVPDLPDYSSDKNEVMSEEICTHREVIHNVIKFFVGMPNWGHPLTLCNVNPPANIPSIIAASLAKLFNPDIIEGEYSWNIAKAEIESGAMLAELMDWDPQQAGGVYTFGGTGSYLYALRLAIASVLGKETRFKGIREDGQLLVAETGHYAKDTCADWSGLGINNHRKIAVDAQGRMDISNLKAQMQQCYEEEKPIVMIVATIGTTDAFAIDPILEIRELIDSYQNAKGYPKPFLYADAVIGWSWMSYKNYDFTKNPLEFSSKALEIIQNNFNQIKHLKLVDAMGIDFHKTGWAPFNSSFFLVKDYQKLVSLLGRELPPYLQLSTPYNPFIFTLETSRGASGALAGWASLKFFGYTGFRVMMGRIVEITLFFRHLLKREHNIICVNPDNYGFVTLFRVYPREVNAAVQYEKELNDPEYREELRANNILQKMVANKLFDMLRDQEKKVPRWENPPYTSFTQGYRTPAYASQEQNESYLIHALKAFPMSPFSNEISILLIRNYVLKARDLVIGELMKKNGNTSSCGSSEDEKIEKWYGKEEEMVLYQYLISLKEKMGDLVHIEGENAAEETPLSQIKMIPEFFHKFPLDDQIMIQSIPLLAQLTYSQFFDLLDKSIVEIVPKDTILFKEGDLADDVFIIILGKISIFSVVNEEKTINIATLKKGEIFGEMAIFESGERSASAKTIGPCRLMKIQGGDFIKLLF